MKWKLLFNSHFPFIKNAPSRDNTSYYLTETINLFYSSSFCLHLNTKVFSEWQTEETCQWVKLLWLMPLINIITMEKPCSIPGPCSYQSVSLSQSLLLWRRLAEILISLPLFPWAPSPYQHLLKSPPSSGATQTIASLILGRLPPKTTCSRVEPQWFGKNDFFSSLSFLQAFLGPWAEHCEPWWDKQKLCVFINHKGVAHTRATW